jgi:NADH-quinone oxidoreductase subunit L
MEGPTPVSALIHAATMVAAGVYMLCRTIFVFVDSATAMNLIAYIGGATALMAATIAIAENDIKRILAYSTLSQLGYMVMAVGMGGDTRAMFHLTTHAFFKALLFLGAGSVIHALHHEQDIWKMGGLWKKTPITFATFIIGTLALAGVPPLSGFYSKDSILLLAFEHDKLLFVVGIVTALLTAYYMGRECFVVFFGKPRDKHAYEHAHESPLVMTLPLIFLAVLSIVAGWGEKIPHFVAEHMPEHAEHSILMTIGLVAVPVVGFAIAALIYARPNASDAPVKKALGPVWTLVENKYYFDEVYGWIVKYVQGTIAGACELFDRWILQRLGIGGLAGTTSMAGRTLRLLQTGSIQGYAFLFGLGAIVVVYYVIVR